MKVIAFGGDGFCGWPTVLRLSANGAAVHIVDNLSRRRIDTEMGSNSVTPISTIEQRINRWRWLTGNIVEFTNIDVAQDPHTVAELIARERPQVVLHFAEQRSAPYSMTGPSGRLYTIDNNIRATHNILSALVSADSAARLIHVGTMGVYGYDHGAYEIPEGYVDAQIGGITRRILHPTNPGSVYHLTKTMDQLMFQFYSKNYGLSIVDLHQGIIWGSQTEETRRHPDLINRVDYDGQYGTVLNRFISQALLGHPLTVYGSGRQCRAFIYLEDAVVCFANAAHRARDWQGAIIINQAAESLTVEQVANKVADALGATIISVKNPRIESESNNMLFRFDTIVSMGLAPTLVSAKSIREIADLIAPYTDRIRSDRILNSGNWRAH